jgi:hypothetical protein
MKTATVVLLGAALATAVGCEKSSPDTATPDDAAVPAEEPADEGMLGGEEDILDEAGEEAEEPAEMEGEAEGEGEGE